MVFVCDGVLDKLSKMLEVRLCFLVGVVCSFGLMCVVFVIFEKCGVNELYDYVCDV